MPNRPTRLKKLPDPRVALADMAKAFENIPITRLDSLKATEAPERLSDVLEGLSKQTESLERIVEELKNHLVPVSFVSSDKRLAQGEVRNMNEPTAVSKALDTLLRLKNLENVISETIDNLRL